MAGSGRAARVAVCLLMQRMASLVYAATAASRPPERQPHEIQSHVWAQLRGAHQQVWRLGRQQLVQQQARPWHDQLRQGLYRRARLAPGRRRELEPEAVWPAALQRQERPWRWRLGLGQVDVALHVRAAARLVRSGLLMRGRRPPVKGSRMAALAKAVAAAPAPTPPQAPAEAAEGPEPVSGSPIAPPPVPAPPGPPAGAVDGLGAGMGGLAIHPSAKAAKIHSRETRHTSKTR